MRGANRLWIRIRRRFITGLAVSLPVITTFVILWLFAKFLAGWSVELLKLIPFLRRVPGPILLLMGLVLMAGVVYMVGVFSTSYLGAKLLRWAERMLTRPPVINTIYKAARQVVDSVFGQKQSSFRSVVLVQFPYKGSWAIGFITAPEPWIINGKKHINVYVPTTPNPTSGWYMLLPPEEVFKLDMSVEEGLKIVISGGVVKDRKGFPILSQENKLDV